jgi:diamine N-acetyltransferase
MPTTMPTEITLRPVTRENLRELTRLTVAEGQERFLTPNTYSVAEAYVEPTWTPLGIYLGETAVGFAMTGQDPPTGQWWIVRLMIGAAHQGKGYGAAALAALVAEMTERHGCREIFLCYVPGNAAAERLYARAGFKLTGEMEGDEVVARLAL